MPELATKTRRELIVSDDAVPSLVESENGDHENRIPEKLTLLWNSRKTVLRIAAVGIVLSTAIAFLIPSRYTSVARLMPPDQSNSSAAMLTALTSGLGVGGGRGSSLGALAGDVLGLKSTGELFVGVLQSRTVEDSVINKFDLRRAYGGIFGSRLIEDTRKDLEKRTDITADRKTGIVTIEVEDHNAHRASAMAQEYVDQLNRVVTHLNTSSAGREREFLEQRLIQVKSDLETAEKGFSDFASKNTAIDIPAQGKAMIEAAATLEGQLIASQTELESLREIYTDNNIRVRATLARVEELKRQLEKLGGKSGSQVTGTAETSGQLIPSIRQLPLLGVPYADLFRNAKVEETIYETLTEEFELAKVQEAKETPSVKILDPPDVPEKRSFPPRALLIATGTVLSIVFGVSLIFLSDRWRMITDDDPRKQLANEVARSLRGNVARFSRNRNSK